MSDEPEQPRAPQSAPPPAEPPRASDPGTEDAGAEGEEPHPFGLFPIIVLLVVIACGIFLVFELRDISSVQDCVWSGRKNCVPVDNGGR